MAQQTPDFKLIFEKEGVYLHTNAKRSNLDTSIPGFIRIVERAGIPALEWSPVEDEGRTAPAVLFSKKDGEGGLEDTHFEPGYEPDWAVISTVKKSREPSPAKASGEWAFSLPLCELYSLRRARFSLGRNFLVLTSRGGHPLPPLHFHRGGTRELLRAMHRYVILDPSPVDARLFLAFPNDSGDVSPSFDRLQLLDDGSDLVQRFIHDPYATTFGGFSKVTNFFRAALKPPETLHSRNPGDPNHPDRSAKTSRSLSSSHVDEYFRMKVQWKSVSEEQEMRNSLLRGYRNLIERDVSRTDRNNTFFSGNDNPGLTLLHDVLMTYCMYNFDLGYVQGMSDLLAPLLFVTQNEVESFWCLTGFMNLVHQNFEESQEAMKKQLLQLSLLLRALDPELCDFLDSQDSGSLCFCFRWLLIWFKREFSFEDILILWEVLWTRLPCENFHLLIACSILESQRGELIGSDHDFNTILKHINELTMKLDLQSILCGAEAIYLQLVSCKELPVKVQEVLGLCVAAPSSDSSPESENSESDRLLHE
ncbi:hypothetical protein WMY93_001738 [Mugilogobius chulae]|uniref:TBC1 domain family member 15 n=1 Tax=Mugilogobius chulae TaxID=88201 RepID=A0AAW0Q2H0_9GOBI